MALPARNRVDFNDRLTALIAVGRELGLAANLIPSPGGANSRRSYLGIINSYRTALSLGALPSLDYSGFVPALNVLLANAAAVLRPELVTPPSYSSNATPPIAGSILTCTTGVWLNTPSSYTYQHKRNGVNIGTNQNTYTMVAGDLGGKIITGDVVAINAAGSSTPVTSNSIVVP
jgi:hypothetical protein